MRCAGAAVALLALHTLALSQQQSDNAYWYRLIQEELQEAMQLQWNTGVAKNVILFIGDGMGLNTVTATRIYKGGESHRLAYERFPHMGLLKTYSADYMIPDSASTATALFTGVKTNSYTVGVDATVEQGDCEASLNENARLESLASLAQSAGKSTGFVTTMRVTHATPAPLYAHSAERNWECEANMPASASGCKDIALQLIEDEPGRNFNVIMGGGRQGLMSDPPNSEADPLNFWGCIRQDGRNLFDEYRQDKETRGLRYSVVGNNGELNAVNVNETDYLLVFPKPKSGRNGLPPLAEMRSSTISTGNYAQDTSDPSALYEGTYCEHDSRKVPTLNLPEKMEVTGDSKLNMDNATGYHKHCVFANGHIDLEHNRDTGPEGMPSLSDMVGTALGVLQKNENGYFLMVEGGNIDMTHQRGQAKKAINEAAALEEAIRLALQMTNAEDTLVIVTSDHSESLAINGYARRGSNIFGIIENEDPAGVPYTTLTYGTGGPGSFQVYPTVNALGETVAARRDPSLDNTDDFEYEQQSTVRAVEVYHGGGDVGVYASGPFSHLFHNVHEQNYVYNVISYAAQLERF